MKPTDHPFVVFFYFEVFSIIFDKQSFLSYTGLSNTEINGIWLTGIDGSETLFCFSFVIMCMYI